MFEIGSRVQIKAAVSRPLFGWGGCSHASRGILSAMLDSGQCTVDFSPLGNAAWKGMMRELNLTDAAEGIPERAPNPKTRTRNRSRIAGGTSMFAVGDRVQAAVGCTEGPLRGTAIGTIFEVDAMDQRQPYHVRSLSGIHMQASIHSRSQKYVCYPWCLSLHIAGETWWYTRLQLRLVGELATASAALDTISPIYDVGSTANASPLLLSALSSLSMSSDTDSLEGAGVPVIGSRVVLTPLFAKFDDASLGPLHPGDVGVS